MEGINIGLDTSFLSHLVLADLKSTLEEMNIIHKIREIQPCNLESLSSEKIDIIILPLSDIPISSEEDSWIITGFLKRQPQNYFCYSKETHPGVFGVKPNGLVAINDSLIKEQIKELRPDVQINIVDHNLAISQLNANEIDAYISATEIKENPFRTITIAASDIIPKTSSGIYAMLSNRVNINARKICQLIHDDQTGYESNVERAIAKELDKDYLINCYQDRAGNYHLNIYNPTKDQKANRVQISQSTFVGLADRALNVVLKKNEKS